MQEDKVLCVSFIISLSYNICSEEKRYLIITIYFLRMTFEKNDKIRYKYFKDKYDRRSKSPV